VEYDPRTSSGPWRCERSEAHTYNSRFDPEVVFDDCPSPSRIRRIFCIEHDVEPCEVRGAHVLIAARARRVF
jgi:hypothetical protein